MAQFGLQGEDADAPGHVHSDAPFPLPAEGGSQPVQVAILAPASGGTLRIEGVRLVPAAATGRSSAGAAAWAWEPRLWQQRRDALIDRASDRGLKRLIVTLAVRNGKIDDPEALGGFVAAARRRGIAVEAVEGDPEMVTPAGLAAAEVRARAIAAYQREAPAEARLSGVQYDIEPYTLAAWGRHPADHQGWSEAVRRLARALGEPVHLVLPFWIGEDEEGRTFLKEVAPAVSGITIMAYRTDAALVTRFAEPLLHWGGAAGKPVRVALEAGPVAEESEEQFVASATGRIAVTQIGGKAVATLLPANASVPGATMFASTGLVRVRPERISFLGAEERMVRTAQTLAAPLSAWPAFDGFAFHGLAWR